MPISAAPSLESAFNLLHIKLAFEPGLSILEIGMIVCMSRIINFLRIIAKLPICDGSVVCGQVSEF